MARIYLSLLPGVFLLTWSLPAPAQPIKPLSIDTGVPDATPVVSLAFSRDCKILAGGLSGETKLWDPASGKLLATLKERLPGAVWSLAFSRDGQWLATGTGSASDGEITIWELATHKKWMIFPGHRENVWSLAFSADSKTLASVSEDKSLKLWDV